MGSLGGWGLSEGSMIVFTSHKLVNTDFHALFFKSIAAYMTDGILGAYITLTLSFYLKHNIRI